MNRTSFTLLVASAYFVAGPLAAQISWTQQPSSPIGPKFGVRLVDHEGREEVVLFGGETNQGMTDETWVWNGNTWAQRFPGTRPSARRGYAAAYDPIRDLVVIFGGANGSTRYGDTWEWNGTTWTPRTSAQQPSPRDEANMAYDPSINSIILFGGRDASGARSDTWRWDGSAWTQLTPATTPPARFMHDIVLDPANGELVLFGGTSLTGTPAAYLADTWRWNGTTWLPGFSASFPSPRIFHALAYDAARQEVLLFGGSDGTSYLDDSWAWDGQSWSAVTTTVAPSGRDGHGMTFDRARQQLVIAGGWGPTAGALADTWTSDHAGATAYGAGCGTPALTFTPDPTQRPVLGQSCGATIANAPVAVAGVAMGWSRDAYGPFSLPVTLASVGMPGCDLWQSAEILGLGAAPTSATTLTFNYSIPALPQLNGGHVYLQSYALAPNVNPAWIITSNAIDWRLGTF